MLLLNVFMKYFLYLVAIVILVVFVWIISRLMKNQNNFFNSVDEEFPEIKKHSPVSYKKDCKANSEFENLYNSHRKIKNNILRTWFLIIIATMVIIIIAGIVSSHYNL